MTRCRAHEITPRDEAMSGQLADSRDLSAAVRGSARLVSRRACWGLVGFDRCLVGFARCLVLNPTFKMRPTTACFALPNLCDVLRTEAAVASSCFMSGKRGVRWKR